ncbi:MAG: hypothetical protein KGL39_48450 [Patescibacteria group bacterium]|nr:hypothetical protein [Patescibacteria group bacterium]
MIDYTHITFTTSADKSRQGITNLDGALILRAGVQIDDLEANKNPIIFSSASLRVKQRIHKIAYGELANAFFKLKHAILKNSSSNLNCVQLAEEMRAFELLLDAPKE